MIRKNIVAAMAGLAVLTGAVAAPAAAFASESGGTKQVRLRKGLTLRIPTSWKVVGAGTDWTRVITGSCPTLGTEDYGFRDAGCRSFWVFGPKAIKIGHEVFQPYTPDGPFYPATDVGLCPKSAKLWTGQARLAGKGLRQVGPGHRAHYRKWATTCVSPKKGTVKARYNQREWYLPTSKILIVDQWDHPGLSAILKNATWR